MIPGVIMEFLNRASVAVASTRDRELTPHIHYVSGWKANPDGTEIACSVSGKFQNHLLASLNHNGQFALTVEQIGPHETYQFKGEYIDSRPVEEVDRKVYEECRERFVSACLPRFGLSAEVLRRYVPEPSIVVRFKVREIFVQTPGPSAGQRLVPRE